MKREKIYSWVVVGLLWMVGLLNYLDRQMLSTLRPAMQKDIGELASATNFGYLMGIFLWIYGFMSPVAGAVADRVNRKGLIVVSLLGIAYKPVMEIMYGASLGKMALKLKVTNLEFEKADVGQILLRNIFHIVPQLITLAFTVSLYMDPEFESVTGFMEFSLLTQKYSMLQFANFASGALTIVDVIMLISDQQKRTLHDRIGGTLVVDNS